MIINFEWDAEKAKTNIAKHGISFEEAANVFKDPMALTIFDSDNSTDHEERWITLGQVNGQRYLVVIHTYRHQQTETLTIRIISARPATKRETQQYQG